MNAPLLSFGERVYRWWLRRLLPRGPSGEAEREMLTIFRDELAEVRRAGGVLRRIAFWSAMGADLLAVAWLERRRTPNRRFSLDPTSRSRRRSAMEHWWLDVKTGARTLRRSPGYAITAILILGLAIGANATIFSLVETLFLAPPPHVEEPESLVRVHRTTPHQRTGALSYPDFSDYRERTTTLSGLAAYDASGLPLAVTAGSERASLLGWMVSAEYFDVLGTRPVAGRWFHPSEERVDAPATVAVISHRSWQRLFDQRADAVGSTLTLNGHPFTVVGVAPAGFRGVSPIESQADLWVPLTTQPVLAPVGGDYALKRIPDNVWVWLWTVGRLAPGVDVEQADAELAVLGEQLAREYPEWNEGEGATVTAGVGVHPGTRGGMLTIARVLGAVVVMVLLIACANVAILLLARAEVRRREAGVRLAIGASRARLTRLMLSESLLVALAGGVVGVALAYASARLAASLLPVELAVDPRPSAVVVLFSMLLSILAAVASTLLPALRSAGRRVVAMLQTERAHGGWRAQGALVAAQVAVSVLLVVGGVLLVRSLRNAGSVELGFGVEGRTVLEVNLRNHGYEADATRAYALEALRRLGSVPGVEVASAAAMMPFSGQWTSSLVPEGRPLVEESVVDSGFNSVAPGYFEAIGTPVVAGRGLTVQDDETAPPVAVVNQHFADLYFPGESAVGKRLYRDPEQSTLIVGVAADARYYDLDEEPQPMVYLPILQRDTPRLRFLVKSELRDGTLDRQLEQALAGIDPEVALGRTTSFERLVGGELGRYRTAATLVGLFAVLALALASVGLYGALSYLVAQRTREIGIRVAIGAAPQRVASSVVRRGLALCAVGAAVGLVAALWATRWLESLLFGLDRLDPLTWLAAPAILLVVALAASSLPARRAARVDPIRAIRVE